MLISKATLAASTCFICLCLVAPVFAQTTPNGEFTNLLAEDELSQFRGYKTEKIGEAWSVKDGVLSFSPQQDAGDLITKEIFDDFELQLEWAISEGGNSGIMFNVGLGDKAPYMTGPEIQILDDENHDNGTDPLTSAGALYALYAPANKQLKPVGQWNQIRIIVQGDEVTHFLNGKQVVEAEIGSDDWNARLANSKFKSWEKFASLDKGHIALQDHGNPVKFRNIKIKRLD